MELSKGNRALLQGRGDPLNTLETEGQMLQRVIPDLMAIKNETTNQTNIYLKAFHRIFMLQRKDLQIENPIQ